VSDMTASTGNDKDLAAPTGPAQEAAAVTASTEVVEVSDVAESAETTESAETADATQTTEAESPETADSPEADELTAQEAGWSPRPGAVRGRLVGRSARSSRRSASARRRRRSSTLVLTLALVATGALWSVLAPSGSAADGTDNAAVREGRALFLQGCSTCHGLNAAGTVSGPSLVGVGSAAVDFQMSTGRMPLAGPGAQAKRKEPSYSQAQIDQIAAYIQTLGGGTEKPQVSKEDLANADLTYGGELYRSNCMQCHQAAGQGAPLTYGKYAPALTNATPEQIIEAMRTGPESMPVFGEGQIDDEGAKAVAAYILMNRDTPSPGGHKLGSYGPVPEGLLGWLIGIGGLLGVCLWIGARQKV